MQLVMKSVGLPLCVHVSVDLFGLKIDTAVRGEGKKSTQKTEIYNIDLSFTVIFKNDLIKRGTNTSRLVLSGATMEE